MAGGKWSIILLVLIFLLAGCKIQLVEKKNVSTDIIIEETGMQASSSAPAPAAPRAVLQEPPLPSPPTSSPSVPLSPAPSPPILQGPPATSQTSPMPQPTSTRLYQPPDIKTEDIVEMRATSKLLSSSKVRVHVLDVGDAESVLIESDRTMLIDCGPEDLRKKTIGYLHGQGIKVIDILLLSNLERERIGACKNILYEFDVKRIVQNDMVSDEAEYKELKARAEELGIMIEQVRHDTNITLGQDIRVELHVPYDKGLLSEKKSHVIVTRLVHGDVSFLFMGDCGKGCERIFHENQSLDYAVTVYGIGAHAEQNSATRLLFSNLSARVGLLSANRSLDIEQADPEVVRRYVDHGLLVYRTDYDGTIVVASDGRRYDISVSRGIEHWKEGTKEETMLTPSPDCPYVAHYNSIFYYTFDCPLVKMVEPNWRLCFANNALANATGRRLDSRCM